MALEHFKTQLLLLHSQQSTLDALGASFNDRFAVHFATTGSEALNTLGETPIHIIVSAQDLPGMSGIEALREAKKRSPDTLGILLAGDKGKGDVEALVGEQEVFQIVTGAVQPGVLLQIVENAARRVRMMTISESANDNEAARRPANVINSTGEHIIMETMENGASVITDATGSMSALNPAETDGKPNSRQREVDVLVLSKDQEFLDTIRACARGLHKVHHAITAQQAQEIVAHNKVGVLVTDAALAGKKVALLTERLRTYAPRLVAVVAGRREDGESMMDLINQGQVYRFLLKPVSPGRARLAIEASVRYHFEAPDKVFDAGKDTKFAAAPNAAIAAAANVPAQTAAKPVAKPKPVAVPEVAEDTLAKTDTFRFSASESLAVDALDAGARPSMPLVPAGIAALTLVALGAWYFLQGNQVDTETVTAVAGGKPAVVTDTPATATAPPMPATAANNAYLGPLDNARFARDTGRLLAPPGDNALEWYMEARLAAPNNVIVGDELAALVDQVLGMTESAMLENRMADVNAALQMVTLADPDNARLAFLSAQRDQQLLRSTLDEARAAIRGERFEDASRQLADAAQIPGADLAIVDQLASDLVAARSAQRVDEVLALANARLAAGQLTVPANDNARYFFALAASNAPGNAAARQGLLIVASKLVLNARAAIDSGDFAGAAALLNDARALDARSPELQATEQALQRSRELQAEATRRSAAARQSATEVNAVREAADARNPASSTATLTNKTAADAPAPAKPADKPPASVAPSAAGIERAATPAGLTAIPAAIDRTSSATNANLPDAAEPSPAAQSAPIASPVNEAKLAVIEQVAISQLTRRNYVAPAYPRSAQRRNISGWVDIAFTVLADGNVADIEIVNSLPSTVFNDSAQSAVEQWRFEPVVENGRGVAKRVAVRLSFNLE